MTFSIPMLSAGFPSPLKSTLDFSEADLIAAALTVGRPNLPAVWMHRSFSIHEALWRIATVRANLNLAGAGSGVSHSVAFDALDPTEKGWVNFSLGMIFAKIAAATLLDIPWLFHFKWYAQQNTLAMKSGKSTPDFIGIAAATGLPHSVEAKGRNSTYAQSIMDKAKDQANQAISVNGVRCAMHIGTMLYRTESGIAFAMDDPDTDDEIAYDLQDRWETWAEYYRVIWELNRLPADQRDALELLTGVTVRIDPRAQPHIESIMTDVTSWERARDALIQLGADLEPKATGTLDDERANTARDGVYVSLSAAGLREQDIGS